MWAPCYWKSQTEHSLSTRATAKWFVYQLWISGSPRKHVLSPSPQWQWQNMVPMAAQATHWPIVSAPVGIQCHSCALSSAWFLYHGLVVSNCPIPHLTADSAFQDEIGVRPLWYLNLYPLVFLYYCCLWKILYCSFRCEFQGLKLLRA